MAKRIGAKALTAPDIATVVAFGVAYFLAHQLAFFFPDSEHVIMAVWPAGGIGLAALLLNPRRLWVPLIAGFCVAGVSADVLLAHRPFLASVGYMTANIVESVGCALLLQWVGRRNICFDRIREVFGLILGAVFVNALSSCIGAAAAVTTRGVAFGSAWFSWYISDGLGVFIITPLIVAWARVIASGSLKRFSLVRFAEVVAFLSVWCTAVWVSLLPSTNSIPISLHPYMLIALLAWPALRLGQHMVSLALVLLGAIAIYAMVHFNGMTTLGGEMLGDQLLFMQVFLGFAASTGFLLAAMQSESRASEEARRERTQFIETLVNLTPDILYIYDIIERRNVYANDGASRVLGYSSQEIRAMGTQMIAQLMHPDDFAVYNDQTLTKYANAIDNEQIVSHYRMRHKNGTWRWLQSTETIYLRRSDCTPKQIFGMIHDTTDARGAEERLRNFQKLESLGVLAGGIAHDFNNLMGGIFGYIDNALELSKEEKVKQHLTKAVSTIDRARGLTAQLLTFARGGAPVQKVCSLVPFVQETVQFALSGSNVSSTCTMAEDLWQCNIDKSQIGQVIDNIIINAQQAMPGGGTVKVQAVNVLLQNDAHGILTAGNYVKMSIQDHGIGMSADILPRIFDPFFTTKTQGHGLGLATCYSIITRHGGAIDVESEQGKGSTFHVYLPAEPGLTAEASTASVTRAGRGAILVMDDEEVMRDAMSGMLISLGYSVLRAGEGREAVALFGAETAAARTISAVILDLTVPGGMGGLRAKEEIRALDASVPIFVASGYADDPVMKNPGAHGFTASICKPFRRIELAAMLTRHVRTSG